MNIVKKLFAALIIGVMLVSSIGIASAGSGRDINAGTGKWSYGSSYAYFVWSQHYDGTKQHSASVKVGNGNWKSVNPDSPYIDAYSSANGCFVYKYAKWNEF